VRQLFPVATPAVKSQPELEVPADPLLLPAPESLPLPSPFELPLHVGDAQLASEGCMDLVEVSIAFA